MIETTTMTGFALVTSVTWQCKGQAQMPGLRPGITEGNYLPSEAAFCVLTAKERAKGEWGGLRGSARV